MRVKKIKIRDETWTFKLVSEKTLNKHFEEDWAAAFVDTAAKKVLLAKEHIDLNVIRHELWHIFFSHTYTNSAILTPEQVEEVSADLFAAKGKEIWDLAEFLQKSLLEE